MEDGTVNVGPWLDKSRNGYGLCIFPNKDFYIGLWKNDMKNGKGKLTTSEKTVYQGEWIEN